MDTPRQGMFRAGDLRKVADAPPPDDPPLRIGDYAALISGGPISLVVDCDDLTATLAWKDETRAREYRFSRGSVRRVGSAS